MDQSFESIAAPRRHPPDQARSRVGWSRVALCLFVALIVSAPVHALHCPGGLVTEGDPEGKVRQRCGVPEDIDQRQQLVTRRVVDQRTGGFIELSELRTVTVWTYNFGSRRLMQALEFRDGRLVDTDSLGYGY